MCVLNESFLCKINVSVNCSPEEAERGLMEGSWGRYWVCFSSAVVCALLYIVSLMCTCNPLAAVWRTPMQRLQRYSNSFWTMSRPHRAVGPDGDGAAVSVARHHPLTSDAPADEIALNDLNRPDLLATGGVASSAVSGAGAASKQKRGKKSKQKQSSASGAAFAAGASTDDRVQHSHPSVDKKTRRQFNRELNMRLSQQVDRISAPRALPDQQ